MDNDFKVEVRCLFCQEALKYDIAQEPRFESGDLITCLSCGEANDYYSVVEIAKNEGIQIAKKQIETSMKNIFKKFK